MRLTKLDGLRGIASLMVVLYHYSESYLPSHIYNFFMVREAFTFVDFFFVLSGFVIAYNYNKISSSKEFWVYLKKRFIRLYPLLFFSVMVYFSFRLFTLYFFPLLVDANASLDAIVLKTLDSLLFTNSTPILGVTLGLNIPSWSISSEMISYIVFGTIAIFSTRKQKRILFLTLIIVLGIVLFNLGTLFKLGDYGFLRGLLSFLLGYFVWEISLLKFHLKNYLEYFTPPLVILCLYGLHVSEGTNLRIFLEFLVPVIFGLVILTTLKTNGLLSKQLDSKPIQFLGKISYSLYLNHYLLLLIIPRLAFTSFKFENNTTNQMLVFAITLGLAIFYSSLTYKYIELGCGRFLKKWLLGKSLDNS